MSETTSQDEFAFKNFVLHLVQSVVGGYLALYLWLLAWIAVDPGTNDAFVAVMFVFQAFLAAVFGPFIGTAIWMSEFLVGSRFRLLARVVLGVIYSVVTSVFLLGLVGSTESSFFATFVTVAAYFGIGVGVVGGSRFNPWRLLIYGFAGHGDRVKVVRNVSWSPSKLLLGGIPLRLFSTLALTISLVLLVMHRSTGIPDLPPEFGTNVILATIYFVVACYVAFSAHDQLTVRLSGSVLTLPLLYVVFVIQGTSDFVLYVSIFFTFLWALFLLTYRTPDRRLKLQEVIWAVRDEPDTCLGARFGDWQKGFSQ